MLLKIETKDFENVLAEKFGAFIEFCTMMKQQLPHSNMHIQSFQFKPIPVNNRPRSSYI